ncbi:helix-turn-helix domain-containing protein [Actinomadura oligospora]|uniref:helix-turn-helix domain-containing protein n=1 Tax=Actinomadura oligospora TaxID=111804 RepID=UPI0012F96D3C|nr:helix-turn-helix domain-containing protein [Actinomadura oligospora]
MNDPRTVARARAAHPLGPHLDTLRAVLDPAENLVVVTDATGLVLWRDGTSAALREADRVGLSEGACWSEEAVGTNGVGTSLATGRPQVVSSTEHLALVLHPWSEAGAPVIDPDTGGVVGCVAAGTVARRLHPAVPSLVTAAARLAEARLELAVVRRDEELRERYGRHAGARGILVTSTGRVLAGGPAAWRGRRLGLPLPDDLLILPDGRRAFAEPLGEVFLLCPRPTGVPAGFAGVQRGSQPSLTLSLLGAARPYARLDARRLPLSLRHAEILALLAMHPGGLSGDRLSACLYGDGEGSPVTVRAEIHRLRDRLGGMVRAKPYRIGCEVEADFLVVRRLLDEGDVATAARLFQGELLPSSDSPAIRAERDEITGRIRRQLLDRDDAEALWRFARTDAGRADLEVHERLVEILPADDPRRITAAARCRPS